MTRDYRAFKREKDTDNPILPICDNEIILDGLEFAFEKSMLNEIAHLHEEGFHFKEIGQMVRRYHPEVLMALVHLALKGKIKRPIALLPAQ